MRTDTIFYQLFLTFDSLLFELLGEPVDNATHYQFISAEIKAKAFRFEVTSLTLYQQGLINSGRIIPIYLDEVRSSSVGVRLIQLILAQDIQAPVLVQQLLQRAKTKIADPLVTHDIIDLLETVLISQFAQLSREEIQAMFLLSDIKQTRVYQEAKQEGRQEGRQEGEIRLLIYQLSRQFGKISDRRLQVINGLTLEQLDDLGEVVLDFSKVGDLDQWLQSRLTN
jgi:hypothetical protein